MRFWRSALPRLGARLIIPFLVLAAIAACASPHIVAANFYRKKPSGPFHGKIVLFGAQREERRDTSCILSVNPDGTDLRTLFALGEAGRSVLSGRVSPDARSIAFTIVDSRKRKGEVWLLDADGGHRMLLDDGYVMAWSPDGKMLACANGAYGDWKSFFFDLTRGERRAAPISNQNHVNDWAHTDDALCVMLGEPDKIFKHPTLGTYPLRQIGTVGIRGEDPTLVTRDPSLDNLWARFSPDDSQVAHYQRKHLNGQVLESLVVSDRDGKTSREILNYYHLDRKLMITGPEDHPYWSQEGPACWSADGSEIACLVSNQKSMRYRAPGDEQVPHYALVFASSQGGFKRSIDLATLGVDSPIEIDWGR